MFIVFSGPVSGEQTDVTLASLNWEPYVGENLDNQGYVAELVREAFKRSGYNVNIQFYPWARVVKLARHGDVDGYFPEYFSKDLKNDFYLSSPMKGGPVGFFKRKGDPVSYTTLKDLVPYRIGVVRGYINTAEFDAADYLKKDEAVNDLLNFKKLLGGRVDLVIADKFVGGYTLNTYLPGRAHRVEFISPPLKIMDLFLCISKKSPRGQSLMNGFEAGYSSMVKDGTISRIMKKAGCSQ